MIFLGGTVGANDWREKIVIPALLERGVPAEVLFNPVVEHWDDAARQREDEVKATAIMLYVIASPDPVGGTANVSSYSLVEAVMSLYDAPSRTIVVFATAGMVRHTAKAINKAAQDLRQRFPGAPIFMEYDAAIEWLAEKVKEA